MIALWLSLDRYYGNRPFGAASLNTTVASSGAVAESFDSTPVNADSAFDLLAGSDSRLIDAATSFAVIGVPSLKLTPWRILKVHSLASAFDVHDSASHGVSCLFSSTHRNSPVIASIARPPVSPFSTGSTSVLGVVMPGRIVPPVLVAPVAGADEAPLPGAADDVELLTFAPPEAAIRNEIIGSDRPATVPRRMNSRRSIRPATYSSTMWFSMSFLRRRNIPARR